MADTASLGVPRVVDSSKVWASLITNKDYLTGLLTLDYSLKQAGTKYPLIALYTNQFPEDGHKALQARGIHGRRVEFLNPSLQKDYSNDPRFYDTWTKLMAFSLVEYERVVLLDSDMLVRRNMDELMDLQLDSVSMQENGSRIFAAAPACACNPAKKAHYPKEWIPKNCAFTAQHSDPEKAQIEGSPMTNCIKMLNSGLIVAVPSAPIYNLIVKQMENSEAMQKYDFPDQGLLSDVFMDRWVPLSYVYNAFKTLRWEGVHTAIWRDDRVKNVHYIFGPKPWDVKPGEIDEAPFAWWHEIDQHRKIAERMAGISDGL